MRWIEEAWGVDSWGERRGGKRCCGGRWALGDEVLESGALGSGDWMNDYHEIVLRFALARGRVCIVRCIHAYRT